jgi:hypothetical protein
MRRATEGDRAGTKERAAQVRRTAAAARDDTARRPLERRMPAVDDPSLSEYRQRGVVTFDVELVARRPVERPPRVGPDLGANPTGAQERERAPRRRTAAEIEVEGPRPGPAEVQTPG